MKEMFNQAERFNSNLSSWDTSSLTTLEYTFRVSPHASNQQHRTDCARRWRQALPA